MVKHLKKNCLIVLNATQKTASLKYRSSNKVKKTHKKKRKKKKKKKKNVFFFFFFFLGGGVFSRVFFLEVILEYFGTVFLSYDFLHCKQCSKMFLLNY